VQAGYQWNDAGGYCGSWATQRAMLSKGAYVSQQQVRDATSTCGGHDEEILSCNIKEAWTNLKIDFEEFDYTNTPLPQTTSFLGWLKKQLVAGNVVAWMIMWSGQEYPIYELTPPAGMYGHIEPVIGIQSNYPLDDTTVYDDDIAVHLTDNGISTVHRALSTLPCKWAGEGHAANCGAYSYGIGNPYGFGWAIKGFTTDDKQDLAMPASLHIKPWLREPDTRSGSKPGALSGTLTATGLTAGTKYEVYRWDTSTEAFTYRDDYKKTTFTAASDTYVFSDDKSFESDGTTYYRVLRTN